MQWYICITVSTRPLITLGYFRLGLERLRTSEMQEERYMGRWSQWAALGHRVVSVGEASLSAAHLMY